jgi:hypothetical protein
MGAVASISDEQPHDKPDALSFSAMISQCLIGALDCQKHQRLPVKISSAVHSLGLLQSFTASQLLP